MPCSIFNLKKNPIFNIIKEKKNLSKNWIKNPNRFAEKHHYERNSRAICRHHELPISLSVIAGLPTGRTKQRKWNDHSQYRKSTGTIDFHLKHDIYQKTERVTFPRTKFDSTESPWFSKFYVLHDVFQRVSFEIRRCTKHADLSLFRALDNGRPGIIGRRATKAWLTMQNRGLIR